MMSYIQTEFVEGSAELGLACEFRMHACLLVFRLRICSCRCFSLAEQVLLYLDTCLPAVVSYSIARLLEAFPCLSGHPNLVSINKHLANDVVDFASLVRDRIRSP